MLHIVVHPILTHHCGCDGITTLLARIILAVGHILCPRSALFSSADAQRAGGGPPAPGGVFEGAARSILRRRTETVGWFAWLAILLQINIEQVASNPELNASPQPPRITPAPAWAAFIAETLNGCLFDNSKRAKNMWLGEIVVSCSPL